MICRVRHLTRYVYEHPVDVAHHYACLHPRETRRQRVLDLKIDIDPAPAHLRRVASWFGHEVSYFQFREAHRQLSVEMTADIELGPADPVPDAPAWEQVAAEVAAARDGEALAAREFLHASPLIDDLPEFEAYAATHLTPGRPLVEAAAALSAAINAEFAFETGATTVQTPAHAALAARRGVCQDFAHVLIGCLRACGVPARYVSGYIETLPPPGQPRLVGVDASHAWVQAWTGAGGWVELDPTNALVQPAEHVTLGWGRDFTDVSPLKGVLTGGGAHGVHVGVDVARIS